MNLVIASGNLTRDPELRYTETGKAVTQFSIAVNEGSGEKRTTEFLDCVAWEKLADLVAEYCRRGRKVLVTGQYTTESWIDRKTNQKRKKVVIKCRNVEFLDRPAGGGPEAVPSPEPDLSDLKF